MEILTYPDERLQQVAEPVRSVNAELHEQIAEMLTLPGGRGS